MEITNTKNKLKPLNSNDDLKTSIKDLSKSIKLMMPRDVQNANSLIFSQINLNKYSWEVDGEKILQSNLPNINTENRRILKFLLLKKIPEEKRKKLWLLVSGAKTEILNNLNYYKNLTQNFPSNVPSPYSMQIEVDLNRTFPEDPFFNKEENLIKLKNILLAYSRRNISIGYCQGFNFIVGKLIKEESFWVFVQIVENLLPLNYFSNMAGVMVDSAILDRLVQISLPDLYNFLINLGFEMNLNNILFKWLVSLYSNYLPENLSLILWDVFLLEGSHVLFKAAIGILKSLKKEIMHQTNIEDIQNIIENEAKNLIDPSQLIYYLLLRKFEFNMDYINKNRAIMEENIIENFFKNKQEKINKERNQLIEDTKNNKITKQLAKKNSYFTNLNCDVKWPLCIFDTYYKHEIINYFIFKTLLNPFIIEDYFFERCHNNFEIRNNNIVKNKSNFSNISVCNNFENNTSNNFMSEIFYENEKNLEEPENINGNDLDKLRNFIKRKTETPNSNNSNSNPSSKRKKHYFQNFYLKNKNLRFSNISVKSDDIDNDSDLIPENLNDNQFSLIIEKNEDYLNNEEDLEDFLYQNEDFILNNICCNDGENSRKFENILIERRPHYCTLFEEPEIIRNKIEEDSVEEDNGGIIDQNISKNKLIKLKRNELVYRNFNKSFTAHHPYFNNEDNFSFTYKSRNDFIYSNLISDFRKTFSNFNKDDKDNQFKYYDEEIIPFKDEEFNLEEFKINSCNDI